MVVRRGWLAIVVVSVLAARASVAAGQDAEARAAEAYKHAVELEAEGDTAGALSLLWDAAGLAPRDADIQNRLGEALERVGALDAAIEAYRLAVAARPAFRKASNNLILALVRAGRRPEAVARARAETAAAPDDPDRHFTLGLAQSEQDVSEAIDELPACAGARPSAYARTLQPGAGPQARRSARGGAGRAAPRHRDRAATGGALHPGGHLLAPE